MKGGRQEPGAKGEYFMFAVAVPRMLSIECMLSRTERIDEFHLKVSLTEKELYEEFLKTVGTLNELGFHASMLACRCSR